VEPARFDVWLYAIDAVADEPSTQALSRVFGISELVAQQLVAALPRIVTHDATMERSTRIVSALSAIGGRCAAVQKPLRPLPVLMVGAPTGHADQPVSPDASPLGTQDTLTLGTQFPPTAPPRNWAEPSAAQSIPATAATVIEGTPHTVQPAHDPHQTWLDAQQATGSADARAAIRPPTWTSDAQPSTPIAAIAGISTAVAQTSPSAFSAIAVLDPQTPASVPSSRDEHATPFDAPAVLDPQAEGALAFTRNLAEWNEALVSHPPRAASMRALQASALALESGLDERLALPAADAASQSPTRMRSASQRAGAPQRLGRRSSAPPPGIAAAAPLNPVTTLLNIHKQAQRSSLRKALLGHEVAGFLLVLVGTSAAFLFIYAAYWAARIHR
jgi:hypothetical protein